MRREAHETSERRKRVKNHEEEILTFSKSIIGKELYISYREILELPHLHELIYRDDARHEISDSDLKLLRHEILESNRARKTLILERVAADLIQARSDAGLNHIPKDICYLKEHKCEALVLHPTSLCGYPSGSQMAYSDVLSRLFSSNTRLSSETYNSISMDNSKPASILSLRIVDTLYISVASKFGSVSGLGGVSALFVCLRCHPLHHRLLSWKDLVRQ